MKTPLDLLRDALPLLDGYGASFAVAGGVAASIYRDTPRLTKDIDLALDLGQQEATRKAAVSIVEGLGLRAAAVRRIELAGAPSMNKRRSPIAIVVGRKPGERLGLGMDILLPSMPWVRQAVRRGQDNCLDYGFADIPTICPEDVIIAKAAALLDKPGRYSDMDDINAIFQSDCDLDIVYLVESFENLRLALPVTLERFAPRALQRASKRRRRSPQA